MLGTTSFILPIYRTMEKISSDQKLLLSIPCEVFLDRSKPDITSYIEMRFGISQDTSEEAFQRISENFKNRGEIIYRRSYKFVQAEQDNTHSFINVEKNFFNDFFRINGSPETISFSTLLMIFGKLNSKNPNME